jgi:hypothetical protein
VKSTATPAKPDTSPAPEIFWGCEASSAPGGAELPALTVGSLFSLKCSGPEIAEWSGKPQFRFANKEQEYTLYVVDVKTTSRTGAELLVTGYKPGEHKPEYLDLGDGKTWVRVRDLNWKINSVIKQEQGKSAPQPYPPYGPFAMSWPWWIWIGLGIILLLVSVFIFIKMKRRRARQALIDRLALRGSALSPFAMFHKELRQHLRRYQGKLNDAEKMPSEYLEKLDESFRQYLSRELLVPAADWPDRIVLRDIRKRNYQLYRRVGDDLRKILRELRRARGSAKVAQADCEQLHEWCRTVADQVHLAKEAKS